MKELPRSVFATPGMKALGEAGIVDANDDNFGGLVKAYAARTAVITKVRPPCFGHMQIKLRGTGEAYRGGFLLLSLLHEPDKPDTVAVMGFWCYDKSDLLSNRFFNYQLLINKTHGDPASKLVFDAMDDDACILALDWPEVAGFVTFEPSARVIRNGDILSDDKDEYKVAAIQRIHPWGKTGWRRLELLEDLLGPTWTLDDILRHIQTVPAHPGSEPSMNLLPCMSPRPASGLLPAAPSFEPIQTDVMLIDGISYAQATGVLSAPDDPC